MAVAHGCDVLFCVCSMRRFEVEEQATLYANAGAAVVSVLTEASHILCLEMRLGLVLGKPRIDGPVLGKPRVDGSVLGKLRDEGHAIR